jgi:hypothetical protein
LDAPPENIPADMSVCIGQSRFPAGRPAKASWVREISFAEKANRGNFDGMKTPDRISSRRFRSNGTPLGFIATALATLCLTAGTLPAADKDAAKQAAKKEAKGEQKKKAEVEEKTVITGSLIPQKVRAGRIPVTTSPVIIISRSDIDRSGASTVAEAIKKQGFGR